MENGLDLLDSWFQNLSDIIWRSLRQAVQLEQHEQLNDSAMQLNNIKTSYMNFLQLVVVNGLIIEKQPSQVMMKDKRFVATVRHMVGDKLDIHKVAFQVRAHLVSEDEVVRQMESPGEM